MFFIYRGIEIYYKYTEGKGSDAPLVFLHGWGLLGESFSHMIQNVENSCLIIDLPPFGKSGEPLNFNIFTYAHMVICLMEKIGRDKFKKASFITHSFGSRIGIIIAAVRSDMVNKLIVISGAGMKPRRGIKYFFKIFKAKLYKFFKIKKELGSLDYRNLSPAMKVVFKNIVNENLEGYAKRIKVKTLLIYGNKDCETPLYMAKRLRRLIKNSKLVILKNAGHFCFLKQAFEVNRHIKTFLEEK